MKKAIAISYFIWWGLVISFVSLLALSLMGPVSAIFFGLLGTLWAAPSVHDVLVAAWK